MLNYDPSQVLSLVAVASGDNLNIDQHFGQASRFLIFAVDRHGYKLLEERPVAVRPTDHKTGLEMRLDLLKDCRLVLAAQVGPGAAATLKRRGLEVLAVSGAIDHNLGLMVEQRRKRAARSGLNIA